MGDWQPDNAGTTWQECAEAVASVLDGERFEDVDQRVAYVAITAGLIQREEQQKPCPTCGKPKHDFSWWRVTGAGRLLVQALRTPTTSNAPIGDDR